MPHPSAALIISVPPPGRKPLLAVGGRSFGGSKTEKLFFVLCPKNSGEISVVFCEKAYCNLVPDTVDCECGGHQILLILQKLFSELSAMHLLEERIRRDGKIRPGNILKVDSFLNHQMDIDLFAQMGAEWKRLFAGEGITKILTIEASGIGIACIAAQSFHCPVIFAKKTKTKNIAGDVYTAQVESFTHGRVYDIIVSKEFLTPDDRVLIIDDFLANGAALSGLIKLVKDAGAVVVGAGIAIEKAFQPGGELIRSMGIRVESLARIRSMSDDGTLEFC